MRILAPSLALLTALAALAASPGDARACGGFFRTVTSANLAIDAQRALLVWRADTVDVHLQLVASTDGTPFAWVLPVPPGPTLALGDRAVFDALDALTTPSVELYRDSGGGGGGGFCGASDASKGANLAPPETGVQHFGGGLLGNYQWDLIQSGDATAVATWLTDHGYLVPDNFAAAAAPYVTMQFLAVRLAPSADDDALDLQPLVVTMPRPGDAKLMFPLGFSRLSAPDVTPVVLYTLADKRYRVQNAASAELATVATEIGRRYDAGLATDYDLAVDALTAPAGGRFVVTEYAHDLGLGAGLPTALADLLDADAHVLTRLYARVPRASLDDLVITFANEAAEVDNHAYADAAAHGGPTALAFGLVGLLLATGALRRRAR